MPIKKEKVEGHIYRMSYLFTKTDHQKHTYLAIPEVSVLKEDNNMPIAHPEAMYGRTPPDMTESVHAVAKNTKSITAAVHSEQVKVLQEPEAGKEEAANKELAVVFRVKPEELNKRREQFKKLERLQSENDQRHKPYLGSRSMGRNGQGQENFARSQDTDFDQEGLEVCPSAQPISPHPVSHHLEVGSAVELVDPPGYGTIRWIGKFPNVDQDIAGVELVSCSFHYY